MDIHSHLHLIRLNYIDLDGIFSGALPENRGKADNKRRDARCEADLDEDRKIRRRSHVSDGEQKVREARRRQGIF